MLVAEVFRLLQDEELVRTGDQWTLQGMAPEEIWCPADLFVGKRVRELRKKGGAKEIILRRLDHKENQV